MTKGVEPRNKTDVASGLDPAHDLWHGGKHPLRPFFAPGNIALVGATDRPGSVGRAILRNLVDSSFGGAVFPVNLKKASVMGIRAYPRISDLPEPADLALVVTPAAGVPRTVEECGNAGIRNVVVISAGFKETGPAGVDLEKQLLAAARAANIRIIGPNCLGVMCPPTGLNATFAHAMAGAGTVGFISQSGALCTGVLDWSLRERVGFSAFISIGSMLDVDWGDLIDYLGDDPRTRSIVIYMESIGDARSFLSAAREVALSKPIIVIKAGRTDAAAKAAASHTGSLAGSDDAMEAAFRRVGVLRVDTIEDLFAMADVLGKQPRPEGKRLTIITNAGGPGVLATDALVRGGGELAQPAGETIARLNECLPAAWSHGNPIDILGDADPARYAQSLHIALNDSESDGVLVVLTPQAMTAPTRTADELLAAAGTTKKPVLASWMGGAEVAAGAQRLSERGIPNFLYPDSASRAFNYMWRYSYNLRGIYETPIMPAQNHRADSAIAAVDSIIKKVRGESRSILTEFEAKEALAAYGIPVVPTRIAETGEQAAECAAAIGFPVVLKLHSHTITHKTDVGGVQLNLRSEVDVRDAFGRIMDSVAQKAGRRHFQGVTVQPMIQTDGYEIILGSTVDPQLGPVIVFGAGGQLVEVMRDRALALPPLTSTLARRMMEQTRIAQVFAGVRGRPPVDTGALEQLIVAFSQLVVQHQWIKEIDINPLLVSHERILALDARVVLHPLELSAANLPRPAIRPYPAQYIKSVTSNDGQTMTVRPIRPEDELLLVEFHRRLSERTVQLRYMGTLGFDARTMHDRLIRRCFNDYDREIALVLEYQDPATRVPAIAGVGRLSRKAAAATAQVSMLIADAWQNRGLGTRLLESMLDVAKREQMTRLVAEILPGNFPMQRLVGKLGFTVSISPTGEPVIAALDLPVKA